MKRINQQTTFTSVLLLMSFLFSISAIFAQTGVRIAGTAGAADNSAMLDVVSTTKGLLIPRMLETERTAIASPATGLIVYQTNNAKGLYYFDGAVWVQLSAGALSGSGVNNFLARWTGGGTSLTTGVVQDNGTNVGIGTAPTSNKLEVAGTENVTSNFTVGGQSNLNGGLLTQGTASTLFGSNAEIYASANDQMGGGVMVANDGGFFDFNNGYITFSGSNGLQIGGSTGGATGNNNSLRINQLAGTGSRPVWADAGGTLNTSGRVYASKTSESGAIGATNTAVLTTPTMAVVTGELILIQIDIELHWTTGSGNDRWTIQSQVNGCASGVISTTVTGWPSADHQGYYTQSFTDLWVATCTGNVTFQCNANRFDADDTWTHRNARIMAIKE